MSAKIRHALPSDIPAAARTLALAFESYPWTRRSIPRDNYQQRLYRLQYIYLTHAVTNGFVLISGKSDGVAAALPPKCPGLEKAQQSEVADLMESRFTTISQIKLPKQPADAWTSATLGVHPTRAGHGLGTALIEECLSHVSRSSTPRIGLETSTKRNVDLYRRQGFKLVHKTHVEKELIVYSMFLDMQAYTLGENR